MRELLINQCHPTYAKQQISKSTITRVVQENTALGVGFCGKYSTRGGVLWQIQHSGWGFEYSTRGGVSWQIQHSGWGFVANTALGVGFCGKYSTRGGVSWQIQHSALTHAVFATHPHSSCCIFSYNTRTSALTSIYCLLCRQNERKTVLYFPYYKQVCCTENSVQCMVAKYSMMGSPEVSGI